MVQFLQIHLLLAFGLSASVADLALGRMGMLPLPATMLTMLLVGGLGGLCVLLDISTNSGRRTIAITRHVRWALTPYLLLVCLSLLLSMLPGAYWGDGGKWLFLIAFGFLLFTLSTYISMIPSVIIPPRSALQLPLALLLASMAYELWFPGYFSTEEARPAGFAGNSNFGALAANMLCASVLGYGQIHSAKRDTFWLIITGIGVIMTQSRSGLLEWLLLLAFYVYHYVRSRPFTFNELLKFLITLVLGVIVGGYSLYYIFEESGFFSDRKTRIDRFMESGQSDDGSAEDRWRRVELAVSEIADAPILGQGTGYARRLSGQPHNLYLQRWVNNGIFGLSLWLFVLGGAWWTFASCKYRAGQGLILVTMVGGLFSHNIMEQHPFLICFGLLLGDSYHFSLLRTSTLRT